MQLLQLQSEGEALPAMTAINMPRSRQMLNDQRTGCGRWSGITTYREPAANDGHV